MLRANHLVLLCKICILRSWFGAGYFFPRACAPLAQRTKRDGTRVTALFPFVIALKRWQSGGQEGCLPCPVLKIGGVDGREQGEGEPSRRQKLHACSERRGREILLDFQGVLERRT